MNGSTLWDFKKTLHTMLIISLCVPSLVGMPRASKSSTSTLSTSMPSAKATPLTIPTTPKQSPFTSMPQIKPLSLASNASQAAPLQLPTTAPKLQTPKPTLPLTTAVPQLQTLSPTPSQPLATQVTMPIQPSTPPQAKQPPVQLTSRSIPQLPQATSAPLSLPTVSLPQEPNGSQTIALPDEKIGIQGNWMKKKDWLLRSNEVFDALQASVNNLQTVRQDYQKKYHAIDKEFDAFYKKASLEQGKIQELFAGLERYLEKKKKEKEDEYTQENQTPEQEELANREYLLKVELLNDEIKKNREELEQLKLDLQSIEDLDKSIIARLERFDEQFEKAHDLYDQAEQDIEQLWDIIDDSLAREIYYKLKNNITLHIEAITGYLQEDLAKDLDSVIETARSQIKKTEEEIKALEEKGFIVKDRSRRIEEIKLQEIQQQEQAKKEAEQIPTKIETIDLKKIKRKPTRWYEKAYDWFTTMISKIYEYFGIAYPQKSKDEQLQQESKIKVTMPTAINMPTTQESESPKLQTIMPSKSTPPSTIPLNINPTPISNTSMMPQSELPNPNLSPDNQAPMSME
ncbi:MAG: Ribonuclease Y [candidate division TM6 bacterium GW2011_GWF2_38_10]|nr:MAG: Ribonuclease Y [candidate division TM6 bacterium GW2011_GWF2_38_10]